MDCGPACLRMIAKYYGKNFNPHQMKNISKISWEGSSMLDIIDAAKKIGIKSTGLEISIELLKEVELPVILHWNKHHFVVLFKIENDCYFIADPAIGIFKICKSEFLKHWQTSKSDAGKTGTILTFSLIP